MYSRLSGRRSAEFAELFSRVGMVLQLRKTSAADVEALAEQWQGKKTLPRDTTALAEQWQGISHFPLSWDQEDLFPGGGWGARSRSLGEKCTAGYARGARGNRAAPCAFC